MLIDLQSKESIRNFSSVKWLIEDESISVAEISDVLKGGLCPYPVSALKSVRFYVNEDYVVFLEMRYRSGITHDDGRYDSNDRERFMILTHDHARAFLKIAKSKIEERANKMKRVVDGFDQPKTKTDPPPELKLPPREEREEENDYSR